MASMSNTVQHRRKAPYQSPYSKQVLSKSWNSSGFASATSSKQRFVANSRTRTLEAQAPPPPEQPELFAEMESTQEALADALEKNAMQEAKCAELGKIEAEKEEEIAQLRVAIAHETDATSKRLEEIAKLRENVSKQEAEIEAMKDAHEVHIAKMKQNMTAHNQKMDALREKVLGIASEMDALFSSQDEDEYGSP